MNHVIEKLDHLLFPEKLRRHITFRLATIFVAVVAIGSLALYRLNGPGSPPEATAQIPKLVHSPGFLAFHALVLVFGFCLIYWTREKKQYYRFRVLFYGMLLGGLVGEILNLWLPLHR